MYKSWHSGSYEENAKISIMAKTSTNTLVNFILGQVWKFNECTDL